MKSYVKIGVFAAALAIPFALSCAKGQEAGKEAPPKKAEEITVISREDGSGTRGAFVELFGVQEKNAEGKNVDMTTAEAEITNSTSVVLTSVAQNKRAIGYISLGFLNSSVRALAIDGVKASVENVKNGSYKITRPFNIAVKEPLSPLANDFIGFILSEAGQAVVQKAGFIAIETAVYEQKNPAGKLTVSGSSSVMPVMEKLKEAYAGLNTGANIELQQSDSTMGINNVISGISEIGMASRELKESELSKGLKPVVIAWDGIAIIVHNENKAQGLTKSQIKDIYLGNISDWNNLLP